MEEQEGGRQEFQISCPFIYPSASFDSRGQERRPQDFIPNMISFSAHHHGSLPCASAPHCQGQQPPTRLTARSSQELPCQPHCHEGPASVRAPWPAACLEHGDKASTTDWRVRAWGQPCLDLQSNWESCTSSISDTLLLAGCPRGPRCLSKMGRGLGRLPVFVSRSTIIGEDCVSMDTSHGSCWERGPWCTQTQIHTDLQEK